MTDRTTAAVLFDIDGTLIDSNYLHIQAWSEALEKVGSPVDQWRVHRAIGMDSAKLLDALLGEDTDEKLRSKAKRIHARRYGKVSDRLRRFDGASELLAAVSERGLKVVLASSAAPSELKLLLDTLDAGKWLDAVTSADDVDAAKPDPDLMHVALDQVGVAPADALLVGDTVWDGQSAAKAGIRFVGVLTGGISAAELIDAGAVAVYTDPAHLLEELPTSPIATLTST